MKSDSSPLSRIADGPLSSRGAARAGERAAGERAESPRILESKLFARGLVSEGEEATSPEASLEPRRARRRASLDDLTTQNVTQPAESPTRPAPPRAKREAPEPEAPDRLSAPADSPVRRRARAAEFSLEVEPPRETGPRADDRPTPARSSSQQRVAPTPLATGDVPVAPAPEERGRRATGSKDAPRAHRRADVGVDAAVDGEAPRADGMRHEPPVRRSGAISRILDAPIAPTEGARSDVPASAAAPRRAAAADSTPTQRPVAREALSNQALARESETPSTVRRVVAPAASVRLEAQRTTANQSVNALPSPRKPSPSTPSPSAPVSLRAEPAGIPASSGKARDPAETLAMRSAVASGGGHGVRGDNAERSAPDPKGPVRRVDLPEVGFRPASLRGTPLGAPRTEPRAPRAPTRIAAEPSPAPHIERPPSVTVTIGRVEIRGTRPKAQKLQPRRAASARVHSIAPNYPGAF